jgi:hypothetical protein
MKTDKTFSSRAGANVATFDQLPNAEALSAFLIGHGIHAHVHDERRLQRWWFVAKPGAGLHVRVPQEELPLSERFLSTYPEAQRLLASAIRCPDCGSCQVQYPAITRKNILPALVAQTAVLFGLMDHECYCEKCQFTWPMRRRTGVSKPERLAAR